MENIKDILVAITAIIGAVSVIVKVTPTLKDDSIWLPIVKFLSVFIALNPTVNHDEIRAAGADLTKDDQNPI